MYRMKSPKNLLILWLLTAVVFVSCNSGKKLYEQGNYYEAVMRSVERLRKSPNNKAAREALSNAYPMAVQTFKDDIQNQKQGRNAFRFTNEAYTYQKLNAMYESIQRSPAAQQVIPTPAKYYTALEDVKPLAAEEQYNAGSQQLSMGTRENAKQAYQYFVEADKFVPGYRDVEAKMDEAYHLSLLHVITHLRPVQGRMYDLSAELFFNEVNKTLTNIEQNEFVRFYTPQEAENANLSRPDQVLEIRFEDFVVGETHTTETIEKMSRDSVKVGEVTLDRGGKRDVYGTVTADVSIYRMEVVSRGIVNLSIGNDGTDNRNLLFQDFPGQFVWFNEWGRFNGDERALTSRQLNLCRNRRIEPIPPQQMFVEFTKPIYQQLNGRLRNFYRNY